MTSSLEYDINFHKQLLEDRLSDKDITKNHYKKMIGLLRDKDFLPNVYKLRKKFQTPKNDEEMEYMIEQNMICPLEIFNTNTFKQEIKKLCTKHKISSTYYDIISHFVVLNGSLYMPRKNPGLETNSKGELIIEAYESEMNEEKIKLHKQEHQLFIEIFRDTTQKDIQAVWKKKIVPQQKKLFKYHAINLPEDERAIVIDYRSNGKSNSNIIRAINEARKTKTLLKESLSSAEYDEDKTPKAKRVGVLIRTNLLGAENLKTMIKRMTENGEL